MRPTSLALCASLVASASAAHADIVGVVPTKLIVIDRTVARRCHGPYAGGGGMPSRYLGFSAIQLSHAGPGVTMA